MTDYQKLMKQATMQIGAGGSAGFVEVCIMHPLDLIKTRLQIQTKKPVSTAYDPHHYNGIVDCMKKMYKHEGLFSFWKGIIPPILAETPKRAVKFFCFEQYKQFFLFGSATPTPLVNNCVFVIYYRKKIIFYFELYQFFRHFLWQALELV